MNRTVEEKAKILLESLSESVKTSYENEILLIPYGEEDGYPIPEMESFCDDCIRPAMRQYWKDHRRELKKDRLKLGSQRYEYRSERDGFLFCERCGTILDSSLLLDDQELSFWESEPLDNLNADSAYMLLDIMENPGDFEERVTALMERLIQEQHAGIADITTDPYKVYWLNMLSPEIVTADLMKYGVERTLNAAQWLNVTLFKNVSSYSEMSKILLCGRPNKRGGTWREQLSWAFHAMLTQEHGHSLLDGSARTEHWRDVCAKRRTAIKLTGQTIPLLSPAHQFLHEIDESWVTMLLTHFDGKYFTKNPQTEIFPGRETWFWQATDFVLSFSWYGYEVSCSYDGAPTIEELAHSRSSWTYRILQQTNEPIGTFLERAYTTFESMLSVTPTIPDGVAPDLDSRNV